MAAEDRQFLRHLYGEGRRRERDVFGWPDDRWESFVDGQFGLQQLHYARHHPDADRWMIERQVGSIGRLDLDRRTAVWRLLEFAIRAADQSQGAGGACMRWLQTFARQAGAAAIDLHVLYGNDRARLFYTRHGFVEDESRSAMHQRMLWRIS